MSSKKGKNLSVSDLDVQQAPPDSQLPDKDNDSSGSHTSQQSQQSSTMSSSKKGKNLSVSDLDVQQAPPDSQLPDNDKSSNGQRTQPSGSTSSSSKGKNLSVSDLDLQPAPADSQLPDNDKSSPYTKHHTDPNDNAIDADSPTHPQQPIPFRNGEGADILGPRNLSRERQDADMLRPPSTDHGTMMNMKWSFADSHTRIEEGGWARQTTRRELPSSMELAGVNMRLDMGAVRELHWHKEVGSPLCSEKCCVSTMLICIITGRMGVYARGQGSSYCFRQRRRQLHWRR